MRHYIDKRLYVFSLIINLLQARIREMKFAVLPKPDLILAAYFLQRVAFLITITVVSNNWNWYETMEHEPTFLFWVVLFALSGAAGIVTACKSSADKFLHGLYTFVASFIMNLCADGLGMVAILSSSVTHTFDSFTKGTIFPMLLLTLSCLVYVFKKSPEKDSDLIIWPTPVLIYFGVCSHLFVYKCVEAIVPAFYNAAGCWIILVLVSVVLTGIGAWKEGYRSGIKIVFTLVGSFFLNCMIGGFGYLAVVLAIDDSGEYYNYGSMIVFVLASLIVIFRFIKTKQEPQQHLILQNQQPVGATEISPVTNTIQESAHTGTSNPQLQASNQPSNPQMQGYNQPGPSNPQMQGYNQPSNPQLQGYNQPSNPQLQGYSQPGTSNAQMQGYNQRSNPQMQGYNQPGPSNLQTQRYGQAGPPNFPMQEFRSTTVDSVNDPTSKGTKEFLSQVQNTVSAEPSCPPQESSLTQTDHSSHLYNEPPPSYSSVTGLHGNKLN